MARNDDRPGDLQLKMAITNSNRMTTELMGALLFENSADYLPLARDFAKNALKLIDEADAILSVSDREKNHG